MAPVHNEGVCNPPWIERHNSAHQKADSRQKQTTRSKNGAKPPESDYATSTSEDEGDELHDTSPASEKGVGSSESNNMPSTRSKSKLTDLDSSIARPSSAVGQTELTPRLQSGTPPPRPQLVPATPRADGTSFKRLRRRQDDTDTASPLMPSKGKRPKAAEYSTASPVKCTNSMHLTNAFEASPDADFVPPAPSNKSVKRK